MPIPDLSALVQSVLQGNARAIARAATLMENQTQAGREVSRSIFPLTGKALTVGITGSPGAGKSTLVNSLISCCRLSGDTVGVVAIDPSSPYSKGALLGDRVRMLQHHSDPGVFIRSMATRGKLGGLAAATLDLVLLLDASGRRVVLIETVGVGQDELDISQLADVTVVVLSPGAGDDIQALKAGILEVADIIAVNKADLPGAEKLRDEILEAQHLTAAPDANRVPVCLTSSVSNKGIDKLLLQIADCHRHKGSQSGNARVWAHRLSHQLRDDLLSNLSADLLQQHARRVSEKLEDPHSAIMALKGAMLASRENGYGN